MNITEMPETLQLCNKLFRPLGLVVHMPGHYVASSRAMNGDWKIYNDCSPSPKTPVRADLLVDPVVAVFLAEPGDEDFCC